MLGRDQGAAFDRVNHAAAPEERIEIDVADRRRVARVVKRSIRVRTRCGDIVIALTFTGQPGPICAFHRCV